ncbi:ABC transporter ATP-binding protein [Streptomyces atratus]|uniref:ABC transporter ATP-binding protein n=1 Tax=Streptomyces atratus TaxID=1893 RepID=UPI00224E0757|nr:ATP-binding cassette domain-containing protein [Streptomyces atratus]MCX5344962.1 ATP-binding cassette domain-containing protein [Streptomyces atratus]
MSQAPHAAAPRDAPGGQPKRTQPGADVPLASVTDLEIRIPDGPVLLRPASLNIRAGQITALTGASGSGKTTLLRALLGHLPAGAAITAGTLNVLGHHVPGLSAADLRELRRTRIAYVGQDPGSALNPRMRIRRVVAETAIDSSEQAVLALLRECRLPTDGGLPDRRPTDISGGQQRRVALARALARAPEILLLDEPTAGLDKTLRDEIAALLRSLATSRNLAVVMACHDPGLVEACADQVVHLAAPGRTPTKARVPAPRPARSDLGPAGEGITARGVSVAFRHRGSSQHALEDVDFTAPPGSATGIVGPSGSGKTTLLRVLAGLHRPDAGALALHGQALGATARSRRREHHRRIQLVPQNPLGTLNPSRTVGAALARPLRLHRTVAKGHVPARVADLLAQVGLPADFADRYPAELSGGQRQRVAIARALATEPDFLLCDEITSALDPETAVSIMELLQHLRTARNMAIAVVSHELHLIASYTEAVHLLEGGRLTAYGPTATLLKEV